VDNRDGYRVPAGGAIGGNFNWNLGTASSRPPDPNDLGILVFSNNSINQELYLGYNKYAPFWKSE
jgi:hypothetical protein